MAHFVEPTGDAPGKARLLVALTITALAFAGYGAMVLPLATGGDLAPLLVAARLIAEGHPEAIYAHDPGYLDVFDHALWTGTAQAIGYTDARLYLYLYPPLWAALLAPFSGGAPFRPAMHIFGWINLAAVGVSIIIAAAQWNRALLRPLPLLLCIAALFFSYPLFKTVLLGQMQPLVVLLVVIAMTASQGARPRIAGAALALAASVKVLPALVAVYWFCNGRRDCAVWFMIVGAALGAASIALAGWQAHVAFLETLGRMSAGYAVGLDNQSVIAALGEMVQRSGRMRSIVIQPVPGWLRWSVTLAAAGCVAALIRSAPRSPAADALAMFAIFLVTTIAAPMAWLHYFFCLAIPLIVAARGLAPGLIALGIAGLLSLPTVLSALDREVDRTEAVSWVGMIACFAVLALCADRIRLARQASEPGTRGGARFASPPA